MSAYQDLIVFGCATLPKITILESMKYLFMTLTNTNHSIEALTAALDNILKSGNKEFKAYYNKIVTQKQYTSMLSPLHYETMYGKDLNCLVQLGIQGIKGAAAYAEHVFRLVNKMQVVD